VVIQITKNGYTCAAENILVNKILKVFRKRTANSVNKEWHFYHPFAIRIPERRGQENLSLQTLETSNAHSWTLKE
jgi:hypothetical protein